MRRDIGGENFVWRIGKVVSERKSDPRVRPADAKHDEAQSRMEAEQVRNDGEDAVSRSDPDPAALRWLASGVRICHAASLADRRVGSAGDSAPC
jgi:hypothetical protein